MTFHRHGRVTIEYYAMRIGGKERQRAYLPKFNDDVLVDVVTETVLEVIPISRVTF